MIEPEQTAEIYEENLDLQHCVVEALLAVAHDAVLIVAPDMRILAANKVARELFPFPPEDSCPRLVDITRNRDIYYCVHQALAAERSFERRIIFNRGPKERSFDLRSRIYSRPTERITANSRCSSYTVRPH